jgi:hypothetical protein
MAAVSAFLSASRIWKPAMTPRQLTRLTSIPCSLSVGTSAPAMRSSAEIARALSLPAWTWGRNSSTPLTPAVTWPPRIEARASPPPEWAM